MLFGGIRVRDHATSAEWYERFFGRPASFEASETESVWGLADNLWLYVIEDPEHAGHSLQTVMVDDLDAVAAELAERGLHPVDREDHEGGARKPIYHDPDGNEVAYGWIPQSG